MGKTVRKYRQSLADQAYDLLRRRIVRLEMAPGHRFVERQISEETGFGATPIREALDRLSQEGLVRTIPRHGYEVTVVDAKYARDFFDLWSPIVTTMHRLALIHATPEQHSAVVASVRRFSQMQADETQNILDVVDELNRVLTFIAEVADNDHLSAIWRRLSAVCTRVFNLTTLEGGDLRSLNHELFVAAWEERNITAVVGVIEHFVERSRLGLMSVFERSPGQAASPARRPGALSPA